MENYKVTVVIVVYEDYLSFEVLFSGSNIGDLINGGVNDWSLGREYMGSVERVETVVRRVSRRQ